MARTPKVPELPETLWTIAMSGMTMAGSFNHVSGGEKFYRTKEECQKAIDTMPSWIGMGDRKRYFPLSLTRG